MKHSLLKPILFSLLAGAGLSVHSAALAQVAQPEYYDPYAQGGYYPAAQQQGYYDPYAQGGYYAPAPQAGYYDPYAQGGYYLPAQQGYGAYDPYAQVMPQGGYYAAPAVMPAPIPQQAAQAPAPVQPQALAPIAQPVVTSEPQEKVILSAPEPKQESAAQLPYAREHARSSVGFYAGVGMNVPLMGDSKLVSFGGDTKVASDKEQMTVGFGYNAQLGVVNPTDFGRLRFEGEFGRESSFVPNITLDSSASSIIFDNQLDLTKTYYGANALFDIGESKISPYVGMGLGGVEASAKIEGKTMKGNTWYYQAMAGATVNLSGKMGMRVGYRYRAPVEFAGDLELEQNAQHVIETGISFGF